MDITWKTRILVLVFSVQSIDAVKTNKVSSWKLKLTPHNIASLSSVAQFQSQQYG